MAWRPVPGTVDAGGLLPRDRVHEVRKGSELRRGLRTVRRQRPGNAIAFRLVTQVAPLGRRDIRHQAERLGGLMRQERFHPDLVRRATHEVDHPVAHQEAVRMPEQLPREGEEEVIVATDGHQGSVQTWPTQCFPQCGNNSTVLIASFSEP